MTQESPFSIVSRFTSEPPADVESIAHGLGIQVRRAMLGPDIAGKLVKDEDGRFTIYVDSGDHPNRQRFTIAHELAHYILHRDLIDSGVVDNEMYRSSLSDIYETQANRLAADMLMPTRLVKEFRNLGLGAEELARRFQVSPAAMRIRLDWIDKRRAPPDL